MRQIRVRFDEVQRAALQPPDVRKTADMSDVRGFARPGRDRADTGRDQQLAAAIRMAKEMGPGHTIVTVLADYGNRYQSKLFNPEFLRAKGLPTPPWLTRRPDRLSLPLES